MKVTKKFAIVITILELVFLLLFGFFVEYHDYAKPTLNDENNDGGKLLHVTRYFTFFQGIHGMIFFGIGFLITFMSRYGYTGVGMNMFLASFSIQTALLIQNVWTLSNGKIVIKLESIIESDFAAASALIAFCALLGKVSPLQMVFFSVIETVCYAVNQHLCFKYFQVVDVGEAVALHLFSALFGLSATFVIDRKKKVKGNRNETPNYNSNLFCMIGTVFLWVYWPSFNSASSEADIQHRCAINTVLALIGSCISSFVVSSLMNPNQKFEMSHIQNATLAGGVSISTTASLLINPVGALTIGCIGGGLSVLGYCYLPNFLGSKIHDPCGVHSLHVIPGFFSGITGVVLSFFATRENYGDELYVLYPAMKPILQTNITSIDEESYYQASLITNTPRTVGGQAGYQLVYMAVSIVAGIVTGLLTGCILRQRFFDPIEEKHMYIDDTFWEIPEKLSFSDDDDKPCNGNRLTCDKHAETTKV